MAGGADCRKPRLQARSASKRLGHGLGSIKGGAELARPQSVCLKGCVHMSYRKVTVPQKHLETMEGFAVVWNAGSLGTERDSGI